MNKERFSAFNWIQDSKQSIINPAPNHSSHHTTLPSFNPVIASGLKNQNPILQHLTPGWSGQSLCSKNYFKALNFLQILQKDLIVTLKNEVFPPKHQKLIYKEYQQYHSTSALPHVALEDFNRELKIIGEHNANLNGFANYYSARLIMQYFLQLRLLRTIYQKLQLTENIKELLSPPLALNKLFAKSTSKELKARCLETNQYSWYRPAEVRLPQVTMLFNIANLLTFPETLKILHALQKQQDKSEHSHALSHLGLGLLINCLQVNLPKWHKNQPSSASFSHQPMSIESSLYLGDFLEELSVSHWIAQENNSHFKWDEILCPHFAAFDLELSPFEFFYNELQQLQLLCDIHPNYDLPLLEFISHVFQRWQKNIYTEQQQTEFFLGDTPVSTNAYFDRVILSHLRGQKNNTHHGLIQKIQNSLHHLREDGYLIILTNQNLYLPSQSQKILNIFKTLTPISTLDLLQVKGKGEAPDYVYVLRKKVGSEINSTSSCINSTFRFAGNLQSFQNFCYIPSELNNFFERFLKQTPTIFQNNAQSHGNVIHFDFFQSPIINGIQVYSNENDSQQITHPQFLKKLLLNTMPLNYYFSITHLDAKELTESKPIWSHEQKLPLPTEMEDHRDQHNSLILILDLKEVHRPNIELISSKLLLEKIQELGLSECSYYQLTSKFKSVNIDLFTLFINSKIGKQIAGISLIGNKNQVRSKINSLLVPTLILENSFTLVSNKVRDIKDLKMTLDQVNFDTINLADLTELLQELALHQAHLDTTIQKTKVELAHWKEIDFNTPNIRKKLLEMELIPLYPNNQEINIEFNCHHNYLKDLIVEKHEMHFDSILSKICLISNNNAQVTLSGNSALIIFIHYLLKQLPKMKILDILTKIKVPSAIDCTHLLQIKRNELQTLEQLLSLIQVNIEKLIHKGINL